jgi:glycosyltransferase involved in cell wall biosynthesis
MYVPDGSLGGSEILLEGLIKTTNVDLDKFNIICSICDPALIDKTKLNILWMHVHVDQDSAAGIIAPEFINNIDAIVFVSHWQYLNFRNVFPLPLDECYVILNAINEFPKRERRKNEVVKLIYTSTPWRGLDVLLDSFELLDRDDTELYIYSSTAIYGKAFYESNDHQYDHLYERARNMKGVKYSGFVPNQVIRQELMSSDIFAYPSNWAETFCLAMVEAAAAGCRLVLTDWGALPEIAGAFAAFTPMQYDTTKLAQEYSKVLNQSIDEIWSDETQDLLDEQTTYFNKYFTWNYRRAQWQMLFSNLLSKSSS